MMPYCCIVAIVGGTELNKHETVSFVLGGIHFEYDRAKQEINIQKHGISFRTAARVFFDENYIEAYDDDNQSS